MYFFETLCKEISNVREEEQKHTHCMCTSTMPCKPKKNKKQNSELTYNVTMERIQQLHSQLKNKKNSQKVLDVKNCQCGKKNIKQECYKETGYNPERFADEFIDDMWDAMNPDVTCRLVEFLVNEFGMSENVAEDFIDCKRTCGPKKQQVISSLKKEKNWTKDLTSVFSSRTEQYFNNILFSQRTHLAREMGKRALNHFSRLSGEKINSKYPKTRTQQFMVLAASRLGLWVDELVRDLDKPVYMTLYGEDFKVKEIPEKEEETAGVEEGKTADDMEEEISEEEEETIGEGKEEEKTEEDITTVEDKEEERAKEEDVITAEDKEEERAGEEEVSTAEEKEEEDEKVEQKEEITEEEEEQKEKEVTAEVQEEDVSDNVEATVEEKVEEQTQEAFDKEAEKEEGEKVEEDEDKAKEEKVDGKKEDIGETEPETIEPESTEIEEERTEAQPENIEPSVEEKEETEKTKESETKDSRSEEAKETESLESPDLLEKEPEIEPAGPVDSIERGKKSESMEPIGKTEDTMEPTVKPEEPLETLEESREPSIKSKEPTESVIRIKEPSIKSTEFIGPRVLEEPTEPTIKAEEPTEPSVKSEIYEEPRVKPDLIFEGPAEPSIKSKETQKISYLDILDIIKEDIADTKKDTRTDRQKEIRDAVENRIDQLIGKDAYGIRPEDIDDAASRVAHWVEKLMVPRPDVGLFTPSPAFGINIKTDSTLEVQRVSCDAVKETTAYVRGIETSPKQEKIPTSKSPMNLKSAQEWVDWATNVASIADEWGEWLDSTLNEAENQMLNKNKDNLQVRENWKQWRDNAQNDVLKWRSKKAKIQQDGVIWSEKFNKQEEK